MSYLLPAGQAPRSNTKLGHLRGLGVVAVNGGMMRYLPNPPGRICPAWGCGGPPVIPIAPIIKPPTPQPAPIIPPQAPAQTLPPPAVNAGTPVPAGYPTSQFFVAPDGSVWEYSNNSGSWFNTGTPYNTGATPALITPAAPVSSQPSSATPVSVTVAPAAVSSGYQTILDWLTQQTLISSVPNWVVGAGVALLVYKFSGKGGK